MEYTHHEWHSRSVVKALSWKLIASVMTFGVSYWFTGNLETASGTAGVMFVGGLLLYYLHERIWNRIRWGKHIDTKSG